MNPLLLTDFYKVHHNKMYPDGMTKLYSNLTARKSKIPGVDKIVFFGLQHFVLTYLIEAFNKDFFLKSYYKEGDSVVIGNIDTSLGREAIKKAMSINYSKHIGVDTKHIEALWDLGYLPIEIKAIPEGSRVPIGVPCLTITNTHPDFGWLTNYLETLMSCMLWQPITSATIAYEYKKLLTKYALETTGSADFVQWQGHDFSMRGMSSVESAILSGMAHLLSFTGTDTIPAIYQLESSYDATGLIGASVPATEHSVMCMGEKESEIQTFGRLLKLYPTGILSVVSDTWDLWRVCTEYLPALKNEILARNGKLVIRPDSGDPVNIICGDENPYSAKTSAEWKGVIELLWDIFGGTIVKGNDGKEYKQLDSHIGAIYGDSITLERADQICRRLQAKGFASTNLVLGIGSYTYQYNTRDTFGFAVKATYGEVLERCDSIQKCHNGSGECEKVYKCLSPFSKGREIWKDPVTDDGTKRSKKGLLQVIGDSEGNIIGVKDQCIPAEEQLGMLQTVFKDGKLIRSSTLQEIRNRLKV